MKFEKALKSVKNSSGGLEGLSKTLFSVSAMIPSSRAQRTLLGISTATSLIHLGRSWYADYRDEHSYVIRVYESDPLFRKALRWMTQSMDDENVSSVTVTMRSPGGYGLTPPWGNPDDDDPAADPVDTAWSSLDVLYDDEVEQIITVDGHKVTVTVENPSKNPNGGEGGGPKSRLPAHVLIECGSLTARKAVLSLLQKESQTLVDQQPRIIGAVKWGSFAHLGEVPRRPLSSVVLKSGQSERILADIKDFLSKKDQYVRLGMPFRRGILLEGPPGTGKSSIATALAHELKMDVYIISLSSLEDDASLLELLSEIRRGSILLLEDIDVASSVKDRDDTRSGVTMSGVLNALDGMTTPQDIITILTTNEVDSIDPAIIRPGRVDIRERIGYVDGDQLRRICENFVNRPVTDLPPITEDDMIVSAKVVECFKRNLDDPEEGLNLVRDLVIEAAVRA